MIGADIIADILGAEDIKFIVGFPENRLFNSAAARGIRPIIARTERVAINIADGFTRMSDGRLIGVAAVQHGPGTEAAFAATAQAFGDGTPILIIASEYERANQDVQPNFRAAESFRNITAWSTTLNDWRKASETFRRAFNVLRSRRSGPVLVAIADDLLYEELGTIEFAHHPIKSHRSSSDPADIEDTVQVLLGARRPVLVAGQGVLYAGASSELQTLAELLHAPVMTTLNGKSAFPEDHPLALGAGGRSRPATVDHFLNLADLVLGIGTSFTRSEYITRMPDGVRTGQITDNATDFGKCTVTSFGCLGDAKLVLGQIIDLLKTKGSRPDLGADATTVEEIARVKAGFLKDWTPRLLSDEAPISPYRVVTAVMRTVDRTRTIVTHDSGNPRDQIVPFYESVVPHGYMGWGKTTQLGTGLGLMMGARLARPDWTAINIMGDAAFGMVGMDFETAVRCRLPIVTIVLNNSLMGGYSRYMPVAVDRYQASSLHGDYVGVARALGGYGERVEVASEIEPALRRCLKSVEEGTAALLEVITKEEPV